MKTCKHFSILMVVVLSAILLSCSKPGPIPGATPCNGISDLVYQSKSYATVNIGGNCWMAENLDVGLFINSSIPMSNNNIFEKYCYNNDSLNCNIFGGLYQWDEIMNYTKLQGSQGICPSGWHIPTFEEWESLSTYLGMNFWAGEMLKDNSKGLWKSPNEGAINRTGFTALPGGTFFCDSTFSNISLNSYFWSSSDFDSTYAWNRSLSWADTQFKEFVTKKQNARSVRCIKDQ